MQSNQWNNDVIEIQITNTQINRSNVVHSKQLPTQKLVPISNITKHIHVLLLLATIQNYNKIQNSSLISNIAIKGNKRCPFLHLELTSLLISRFISYLSPTWS